MYAKIFQQIYDGTLCTKETWQALVTFQQLLILANRNGVVDMTVSNIADRTKIPIEIIQTGIQHLSRPDKSSRNPAEGGRRIVLLDKKHRDWGWRIVSYELYRNIKNERERSDYFRKRYEQKKLCIVENGEKRCTEVKNGDPAYASISVDSVEGGVGAESILMEICRAYPKTSHYKNEMEVPTGLAQLIHEAVSIDGATVLIRTKRIGELMSATPKFLKDPRVFFAEKLYRLPDSHWMDGKHYDYSGV